MNTIRDQAQIKDLRLTTVVTGEMVVMYLYMRYRYHWNEVMFSMFTTFAMVTNLIDIYYFYNYVYYVYNYGILELW
ncbi:hypothetical protein E2986_03677 [Frieseomelitta varia]|uniref:Uncharacterized protein n=1 Tax=Frieseomelitta varia TaxID=561572 RepID=A0A833SGF0_9HYME|nr:hypothetical protein E2986_03677 [Frieseomelitta varia]